MCETGELLIKILQQSDSIINHVHCYNSSSAALTEFVQKLQKNIECLCFNCVESNVGDILANVNGAEMSNHRTIFFLFNIDAICRNTRNYYDNLKLLLKRFANTNHLKLVTTSKLSWFHIQSNYFRTIISNPIQLNFSSGEDELSSMLPKLGVTKAFSDFVINVVGLHYKKPRLLFFIVKKAKEEYIRQGLNPTEKMSHRHYVEVGKICTDLIKNDNVFSLKASNTTGISGISQFPILTKCAIVAVYCASYNAPSSDQRFFFKKSVKQSLTSNREKIHDTGPRPFDHQRALFIFSFIWKNYLDDHVEKNVIEKLNVDFNAQLTILMKTGIVQLLSAFENISEPKYRCLCPFSLADNVAKSLDLNIKEYLADFAHEL